MSFDKKSLTDILKVEGVMAKGYGIVPKLVMQDPRLSRDAKAIYSYICAFAGAGSTAFPGVKKICKDLCFGKIETMVKHRRQLEKYGYIKVEQERTAEGKFARNIYTLIQFPEEHLETLDITEKLPSHHLGDAVEKQEIAESPFWGLGQKATPSKRDSIINRSLKININNKNTTTTLDTNISKKTRNQTKQQKQKDVVVDKPESINELKLTDEEEKSIKDFAKANGVNLSKSNVLELWEQAKGDIERIENGILAAIEYAKKTKVSDFWALIKQSVVECKIPSPTALDSHAPKYDFKPDDKYKYLYLS